MNLLREYIGPSPTNTESDLEARSRIPHSVFNPIIAEIEVKGLLVRRLDTFGKKSLYPVKRIVTSIRMMALGVAGDALDEYCRMSGLCSLNSMK